MFHLPTTLVINWTCISPRSFAGFEYAPCAWRLAMPITGLSRHGRLRSPDFPAPAPIVQRLGAAYAALALVPFRGPYDARRPLSPVLFFCSSLGCKWQAPSPSQLPGTGTGSHFCCCSPKLTNKTWSKSPSPIPNCSSFFSPLLSSFAYYSIFLLNVNEIH